MRRPSLRVTSPRSGVAKPSRQASTATTRQATLVEAFETTYRQRYGFLMPGRALVIEAISAEAIGQTQSASETAPVLAARAGGLQARARVVPTQRRGQRPWPKGALRRVRAVHVAIAFSTPRPTTRFTQVRTVTPPRLPCVSAFAPNVNLAARANSSAQHEVYALVQLWS